MLPNNLSECPYLALRVQQTKIEIVIDLNGHTITGNPEIGYDSTIGIMVFKNRRPVRILATGTIRGFFDGIEIQGTRYITVENVTVRDSSDDGIQVLHTTNRPIGGLTRNGRAGRPRSKRRHVRTRARPWRRHQGYQKCRSAVAEP